MAQVMVSENLSFRGNPHCSGCTGDEHHRGWPPLHHCLGGVGFQLNSLQQEENAVLDLTWNGGVHSIATPIGEPPRYLMSPWGQLFPLKERHLQDTRMDMEPGHMATVT